MPTQIPTPGTFIRCIACGFIWDCPGSVTRCPNCLNVISANACRDYYLRSQAQTVAPIVRAPDGQPLQPPQQPRAEKARYVAEEFAFIEARRKQIEAERSNRVAGEEAELEF